MVKSRHSHTRPSWISQAADACDCCPPCCHEKAFRGPSEGGTQRRGSLSSLSPKLFPPSPDTRQVPPGMADVSPALPPHLLLMPFSDKAYLSVIPSTDSLLPSQQGTLTEQFPPNVPPPSLTQSFLILHLVLDTWMAFSPAGDQGNIHSTEIPNGGHV